MLLYRIAAHDRAGKRGPISGRCRGPSRTAPAAAEDARGVLLLLKRTDTALFKACEQLFGVTFLLSRIAMGVPVAPLGLLVAVETIPDIFRTLGNVTMDLATTVTVSARSGEVPETEGDALLRA